MGPTGERRRADALFFLYQTDQILSRPISCCCFSPAVGSLRGRSPMAPSSSSSSADVTIRHGLKAPKHGARVFLLYMLLLAAHAACSSSDTTSKSGSEDGSSASSVSGEGLCEYWGLSSHGLECNYSGVYTKPSHCTGLGKRYCDRSYTATECPEACTYERCSVNEDVVMQFANYHPEFLWTDLVVANNFDMVSTYGKYACTSVCWQSPWKSGCYHGHWWKDRRYCSQIDCSHDELTRYLGCHKTAPFHKPSCTECAVLFPQADCGLQEYYPLTQFTPSKDYQTKEMSAECESDASSRECKELIDSLSSAHNAVTSDATAGETSEMQEKLDSLAAVLAEDQSVKEAEISAQLEEGIALGVVTIAGDSLPGGQAETPPTAAAAAEYTKLIDSDLKAVTTAASSGDLENTIDFLEIQLQIDPMRQLQWLVDVINSLPDSVFSPEALLDSLQTGESLSLARDAETGGAIVVVDGSGKTFQVNAVTSFGAFIAAAKGLIETTVKQALSVVSETGMYRIQVVSIKSMNDEMLKAGLSHELLTESDLLTVTAVVWSNSPDLLGEKINSRIASGVISQSLSDAGLPSFMGPSMSVNVLSARVAALRQAAAFEGMDLVIKERLAAAQANAGDAAAPTNVTAVGGVASSEGLSTWAIVGIGAAVGLIVGPGIGWVVFYVRTVKRNRARKEAARACSSVTNPMAEGFSKQFHDI